MSDNERRADQLMLEAEILTGPHSTSGQAVAATAAASLAAAHLLAEILDEVRKAAAELGATLERLSMPAVLVELPTAEPEAAVVPAPAAVVEAQRPAPVKRTPAKRATSRKRA